MTTAQEAGLIANFAADGELASNAMPFIEAEDVRIGDIVTVSIEFEEPEFTTPIQQAEFARTFTGTVQEPLPEYATLPGSAREMWIGGLILRNDEGREMRFTPGQTARNIGPRRGSFEDTYAQGVLRIQRLAQQSVGARALHLVQSQKAIQAA